MVRTTRFIIKTIIDVLIAGLLCIATYQENYIVIPTIEGYFVVIGILLTIVVLIFYISKRGGKKNLTLGLVIALIISIIEVSLIGISFGQPLESIILAWFVTLPAVIIFDKLLG